MEHEDEMPLPSGQGATIIRCPDEDKTFALAEYAALRAEILLRVAASQALERNALIAAALIDGFLYVHPPHGWQRGAWFLPVLIAAFGLLRTQADEQVFRQFGDYIERAERFFLGNYIHGYMLVERARG